MKTQVRQLADNVVGAAFWGNLAVAVVDMTHKSARAAV